MLDYMLPVMSANNCQNIPIKNNEIIRLTPCSVYTIISNINKISNEHFVPSHDKGYIS